MKTQSNDTPDNTPNINTNPFSRAFNGLEKLFEHNQIWAIIILVATAVASIPQFMPGSSTDTRQTPTEISSGVGMDERVIMFIIGVGSLVLLVGAIIGVYINGIIAYVTWKTSKGQKAGIVEAFKAVTERFWTLLVVQVFASLKIIGGLLLFIVPGIRAMLRYQMVLLPVFDENLTARKAMARVKKLTKKHLMEVFGITTVSAIIPIIGSLLSIGGQAVMYPQLKQLEHQTGPLPKVHWLNYLGLLLIPLLIFAGIVFFSVLSRIYSVT